MLKWLQAAVLLSVLALASAAHAGVIVEGSVGKGVKLGPSPVEAEQTNVMIAPGVTFLSLLRLELGFAWDVPDVRQPGEPTKKGNLELRPMVVVAPPILPLYGRAVFAFTNLAEGKSSFAWGAAGGVKIGVGPLGVFAEVGLIPRSRFSHINWVGEGRLGAYVAF
jgi:hypothetical protein